MTAPPESPITIFALACPFRKDGSPVLGNFGRDVRGVIVFEIEQWRELCRRVPELGTMTFRVGEGR